jgi:hypothetical protein
VTPAEHQKALRDKRKALGLCLACSNQSRPGKSLCASCQKKRSDSTTRWRKNDRTKFNEQQRSIYHKKKQNGQCVRCSNLVESSQTFCSKCQLAVKKIHKRHYEFQKASNKCVDCGQPSANGVLCNNCKSKRNKYLVQPQVQIQNRLNRESNWRSILLSNLKARAKKRGINIDPNLSVEDIPDPAEQKCPIFGTSYIIGTGCKTDFSATIDRIEPSLGYVRGNLQLLSSLANDIKNSADSNTIRAVGNAVCIEESKSLNERIIIDNDEFTRIKRQNMVAVKKASNKRKRKLEFSIEWFNINLPTVCPCTGIELDYNNLSKDWRNWPSIDRINNSLGYVPGNVWVISAWANSIKSNATGEQIIRVADWMDNQLKGSIIVS